MYLTNYNTIIQIVIALLVLALWIFVPNWKQLIVLYHMIPKNIKHLSYQERLELFYKNQVEHYDTFREKMLWGRAHLMKKILTYISDIRDDLVWIDFGGGTGFNIEHMAHEHPEFFKLFKKIYIVDLCPSMCNMAKKKIKYSQVEIVCQDVAKFVLPSDEKAHLITFSYVLSMIPDFYEAVDHAKSLLTPNGVLGVTDFVAHDGLSWMKRSFWLAWFDLDNIKLGDERVRYLQHTFKHSYYIDIQEGSVPYMFMKVPYYIFITCGVQRY